MTAYDFVTLDVFTDRKFTGNQLAVLLDAQGLTLDQMQTITREFNYAESTFVLPNEDVEIKVGQVFDKLDGPVMIAPVFTTHAPDGTLLEANREVIKDPAKIYPGQRIRIPQD